MKHRLVMVLALVISVALIATGCAAKPTPTPTGPAEKVYTIGVVHNNADHPSITAIVKGMDDEAKHYPIKIIYLDPAFDPQKQVSMIEDLIAKRVDLIVVNAVDPTAVVAAIKKAYDAGIPVITHNANCAPEGFPYIKTYVGSQSYDQGYAVGKMMVQMMGGKGKVVFIIGKPGQTDVVNRLAGLQDAWKDANASFQVIAEQPADWMKDKALRVMEDLLTRYPEIDAVFACDDPMALGALEAIKAAGRLNKIKVFGVNGNVEACQAIKAGEMGGTALQLSYLTGVYTVRAAYDVLVGRIVPPQILSPTQPVSAQNVAQWMSQCW